MRCLLLFLLWGVSSSALAVDQFAERLAAAETQAATASGKAYVQQMHDDLTQREVGIMLKKCSITTGSEPQDFTLVASVSRFRRARYTSARPQNAFTDCFVQRLSGVVFPWLPADFEGRMYPIVLHIQAERSQLIEVDPFKKKLEIDNPGIPAI